MKTFYPELPLIENIKTEKLSFEEAVKFLLKLNDECLARAIFGIIVNEASIDKTTKQHFYPSGEFNYAGIQTDVGRWPFSTFIVSRFRRTDVGKNYREFAGFKDKEGFLNFMANNIKLRKYDGCNADKWTEQYIQTWWSPAKKKEYTKGTLKFNQKKANFLFAMKIFDEVKKKFDIKTNSNYTPSGFLKNSFFPILIIIAIVYFLRK